MTAESSSQNHAERVAYLQREIKAIQRKRGFAVMSIIVSFLIFLFLLMYVTVQAHTTLGFLAYQLRMLLGLNSVVEAVFLIVGLSLFVLGVYILRHAGKAEPLEREFAELATPEDWMNKTFE